MVGVILVIWFVMSFLTNILGPLIPDIVSTFKISLAAAAMLPFAFFIAYGLLSIPAGFFVQRWREKKVILWCFLIALAGSLWLASMPRYWVALASLFLIGGSMAVLQVAINPLLRTSGGEEHFAFNSALAQLVFGSASFISPLVYVWTIAKLQQDGSRVSLAPIRLLSRLVPPGLPWVAMYWIFAVVIVIVIVPLFLLRFPAVHRTQEEDSGTLDMYKFLLRKPAVFLFFTSVFLYVGSEQGTADWMSEFLLKYHGYNPHTVGSSAVSWFWGGLTIGCFVGMGLLKLVDSRLILRVFSGCALVCLTLALFGPAALARIAFPCIGLFASIMWPTIISLGLNSILEYPGPLTGILCSGIMGGACVPLLIGRLADSLGLRAGMSILYFTFGWVGAVSFWARPLIVNKTVSGTARKGTPA
jgi:fucose permease